MFLYVFTATETEKEPFVKFWSDRYTYAKGRADLEHLYQENIHRPLTKETVLLLFKWKNGSRLARKKEYSVKKNYVANLDQLHGLPDDPREFLRVFGSGGAIWRIFWLHCWKQKYPIFDQHVYRAMKFILAQPSEEILQDDDQKVNAYLDEYLPFWNEFIHGVNNTNRRIDKALVTFGKFVKAYPFPV